jgi:hypothetical protein
MRWPTLTSSARIEAWFRSTVEEVRYEIKHLPTLLRAMRCKAFHKSVESHDGGYSLYCYDCNRQFLGPYES